MLQNGVNKYNLVWGGFDHVIKGLLKKYSYNSHIYQS